MSSSNCGLIRLPRRYNQHQVFLSNQYHKSSRLPNTFFQILLLQPTKRDSSTILKKDLFKSFTTSAKIKITCIPNCFVNPPRHLDPQIIIYMLGSLYPSAPVPGPSLYSLALANNPITNPEPDPAYTDPASPIHPCIHVHGRWLALSLWGLNLHFPYYW